MATKKLRFALFGNTYQAKKSASIKKILCFLQDNGAEILIDRDFHRFLTEQQQIDVMADTVFSDDNFDADFAISMGGDGTLLKVASRVAAKNIPIVGINIGRLGFLADISPSDIEQALGALFSGEYKIEEHSMIEVESSNRSLTGRCIALNDIALLKRDNASMISIRTSINGEYLTTYQADGLIVTTPTGSTAYSLSNGGPIIVPQTSTLCLTPVAPHSLNTRPVVIPDNAIITLKVESRNHNFLIAMDGRSEKCNDDITITIRRTPFTAKIVKRNSNKYFSTLREKMMWGRDIRE